MPHLRFLFALILGIALAMPAFAQAPAIHGKRSSRLIIRNAMVIDGTGTPASGPYDIVIDNNRITQMVALSDAVLSAIGATSSRPQGGVEIDATGKYVMPGLVNAHAHVQDERGGVPQELEYELKIWLASGITAVRDVGSDTRKTLPLRDRINAGQAEGPRLFHYPMFNLPPVPNNAAEARARVREYKAAGVDGIKFLGTKRDVMEALLDEAKKVGLRTAHHAAVEETNAWDDIR